MVRKVWLFALVLGHSRFLWGRFCSGQDQGTVLRCHILAFEAIGGASQEILYDRMKTAVLGEGADGVTVDNPHLVDFLNHYGTAPRTRRDSTFPSTRGNGTISPASGARGSGTRTAVPGCNTGRDRRGQRTAQGDFGSCGARGTGASPARQSSPARVLTAA